MLSSELRKWIVDLPPRQGDVNDCTSNDGDTGTAVGSDSLENAQKFVNSHGQDFEKVVPGEGELVVELASRGVTPYCVVRMHGETKEIVGVPDVHIGSSSGEGVGIEGAAIAINGLLLFTATVVAAGSILYSRRQLEKANRILAEARAARIEEEQAMYAAAEARQEQRDNEQRNVDTHNFILDVLRNNAAELKALGVDLSKWSRELGNLYASIGRPSGFSSADVARLAPKLKSMAEELERRSTAVTKDGGRLSDKAKSLSVGSPKS